MRPVETCLLFAESNNLLYLLYLRRIRLQQFKAKLYNLPMFPKQ